MPPRPPSRAADGDTRGTHAAGSRQGLGPPPSAGIIAVPLRCSPRLAASDSIRALVGLCLPLAVACGDSGGSHGGGTGNAEDSGSSPMCGNLILESGEACEGATLPVGCDPATCSPEPGYACEVGYDPGTQAVTSTCTALPACGNGVVEGDEECDDGNLVIGDGCTEFCTKETPKAMCGDGMVEGDEECDDGSDNSDTMPDACRTDCTAHRCGDGVIDTDEGCDDGNTDDADGCPGDCQATPEVCDNGTDDDGDALVDCDDPDCAADPACACGDDDYEDDDGFDTPADAGSGSDASAAICAADLDFYGPFSGMTDPTGCTFTVTVSATRVPLDVAIFDATDGSAPLLSGPLAAPGSIAFDADAAAFGGDYEVRFTTTSTTEGTYTFSVALECT